MRDGRKKQLAVGIVKKDLLPGITPTGHMIKPACKLQP
jgi:hypothetical protein